MSGDLLEVMCPAGVSHGDLISINTTDGRFEVKLPEGVSEGQTFTVWTGSPVAASAATPDATPAQIAGMQKLVADMATTFLATVLARLLSDIERASEVQVFIDDNSSAFVDYRQGGEHLLEWTTLHDDYCRMVEHVIESSLRELSTDAQTIYEYAAAHGGDPRADKLLARLRAAATYDDFCALMQRACEDGPCAC